MTDFAIGEIESLVFKAYRGTGMSWGLAEEAGRAAGWLASHGLPGTDAFAGLVAELDETPYENVAPKIAGEVWTGKDKTLCPVICGVTYCDMLPESKITLSSVSYPLIMAPFVAIAARALFQSLQISWPTVTIKCSPDSVEYPSNHQVLLSSQATDVSITACGFPSNPITADKRRGTIEQASREILERFAHRTYVPASEESRLSGAGAGLTDND